MKHVVPRLSAERDIDDAVDYYSDEAGRDVARRFIDAVSEAYRAIGEHPGMGSPRYASMIGIEGLRSRKLGRFPFLIFYVELSDHIDVWRVLHTKRDIPTSLSESRDGAE